MDDGDTSEDRLIVMYCMVGFIAFVLVSLGIFGFACFRTWLSLDKPSYTPLRTDSREEEKETNFTDRV